MARPEGFGRAGTTRPAPFDSRLLAARNTGATGDGGSTAKGIHAPGVDGAACRRPRAGHGSAELAGALRGCRGLVSRERAELGHRVRDVDADGLLADIQSITDLAVGVTLGHEAQDIALPSGQR